MSRYLCSKNKIFPFHQYDYFLTNISPIGQSNGGSNSRELGINVQTPTEGRIGLLHIKYFQVCNARTLYHPLDHPYMIKFTAHTKVQEVQHVQPSFPTYAYTPATFEALHNRVGIIEYCSGKAFPHFSQSPSAFMTTTILFSQRKCCSQ